MIERIFYGRNGLDALSLFLLAAAMILLIPHTGWLRLLWIIAAALIVWAVFRAFSRNIGKRRTELWRFQSGIASFARFMVRHTARLRAYFAFQGLRWRGRKTTVYFKCPHCKKILSLPRHRGKLAVTCTVCGHKFIRKT